MGSLRSLHTDSKKVEPKKPKTSWVPPKDFYGIPYARAGELMKHEITYSIYFKKDSITGNLEVEMKIPKNKTRVNQ
jgi:hypothetical protein